MAMPRQKTAIGINVKEGDATIEVRIQFSTRGLERNGGVRPKHAWTSGEISMQPSKAHAIKTSTPRRFDMVSEISHVVAQLLNDNDIVLHASAKMERYLEDDS